MHRESEDRLDAFYMRFAADLNRRCKSPSRDVWPNPHADITAANDITADYVLDLTGRIYEENGGDVRTVAQNFLFPSRIVYLMYLFSSAMAATDKGPQREKLAYRMIDSIDILRDGDYLLRRSGNLLAGMGDRLPQLVFYPVAREGEKNLLRRICATLSVINEFEYFAWVGIGREFHGPYDYEGRKIFIREYYDLKPYFWRFCDELPFEKIAVCYDGDTDVSFDLNGRAVFHKPEEPKAVAISIDGCPFEMTATTLQDLLSALIQVVRKAKGESSALTSADFMVKYAQGQLYSLAPNIAALNRERGGRLNFCLPAFLEEALRGNIPESTFGPVIGRLNQTDDEAARVQLIKDFFCPKRHE